MEDFAKFFCLNQKRWTLIYVNFSTAIIMLNLSFISINSIKSLNLLKKLLFLFHSRKALLLKSLFHHEWSKVKPKRRPDSCHLELFELKTSHIQRFVNFLFYSTQGGIHYCELIGGQNFVTPSSCVDKNRHSCIGMPIPWRFSFLGDSGYQGLHFFVPQGFRDLEDIPRGPWYGTFLA